ncbi:sensor histidine kinase [Anaeromassilibacillus sp. An172]|uniref:sensor histidine kinase n=1 Tax=Anaeromassilibacillus sp. An172 TaxID=1965570 RepID=UPI001FA83C72|nr:HAMP domain-containing sensor histidine kinase [Anaeromassilibacillus sp. An172]
MKQIKHKFSNMPLRYRVVMYFLLFSFIMLILLWLFQTVFFKGFYRSVKISQVESCAKNIITMMQGTEDDEGVNVDKVSAMVEYIYEQNDMMVALYDLNTNFAMSICSSDVPENLEKISGSDVIRYRNMAIQNGGTYLEYQHKALNEDSGSLEKYAAESVTYSEVFMDSGNGRYMITIRSIITPFNSVVDTLRNQLIIISAILVVLSVMLSIIVSNLITRPIIKTNKAAKELAKQNYDVKFESDGYLEIRELNDTLNFAARELTKVEKLRQDLIANISHDLRTPLTMITGYGEVIRDLPGENTPENIQIIIDEATRLNELVTDLLDISKLQSGAMQLVRTDFSLTKCIEEIFNRYTKLIEQNHYNIVFNYKEDVIINADDVKIKQVIYNLINNAINYVGDDKTVIVTQIADKNFVRVEVTDHGVGIDPDKLEYIWDRYYKVDKAHKSAVIGTGLGLSIVKNILELHNARFGVKSKLGAGSTFWFELPVQSIKNKHYMTQKIDALEISEESTINAEVVDLSKKPSKKKETAKKRKKSDEQPEQNTEIDDAEIYEYEVSGHKENTEPEST